MGRLRTGPCAVILLLSLTVGCSGEGAGEAADDLARSSPTSAAEDPASPTAGSSPTTASPAATDQGRPGDRVEVFHGARVFLPKGWRYDDAGGSGLACVDAVNLEACSVQLVNPVALERDGAETDAPDPEADYGWWLGTDVPACADVAPEAYDRKAAPAPLLDSRISERGFRPLGDKTAVFRAFTLTCEGKTLGTARLWLLPDSKLAVVALDTYGTTPPAEVDRLVARMDTDNYRA